MKELRGIQGGRPITDEEMTQAKETPDPETAEPVHVGVRDRFDDHQPLSAGSAGGLLPELREERECGDEGRRAARCEEYVDLEHLNIVIVGDRKSIEEPLKKTGIAPIVILDAEGKPGS